MKSILWLFIFLFLFLHAFSQNIDIDMLRSINAKDNYSGYWRGATNSIYKVGFAVPVGIALSGVIASDSKFAMKGVHIGESIILSTVLTELIKRLIKRERPSATWSEFIHAYKPGNDHKSFPSGHTTFAFSFATATALEFRKWYITIPCYAYAASVGYSRMYLGAHYPSDVLSGAVVGTGSAFFIRSINH